jgi:hypothetical protein
LTFWISKTGVKAIEVTAIAITNTLKELFITRFIVIDI